MKKLLAFCLLILLTLVLASASRAGTYPTIKVGETGIPDWMTVTSYNIGNDVVFDEKIYTANVAHISDIFASESSAGFWTELSDDVNRLQPGQVVSDTIVIWSDNTGDNVSGTAITIVNTNDVSGVNDIVINGDLTLPPFTTGNLLTVGPLGVVTETSTIPSASLTTLIADNSVVFVSGTSFAGEVSNFSWDRLLDILNVFGSIDLASQSPVRWYEQDANGTDFAAFTAADSMVAPVTWKLPDADGGAGEAMLTDGLGNLSFGPVAGSTTLNPSEVFFGGFTGAASSSPDFIFDDVTKTLSLSAFLDLRDDSPLRLYEQIGNGTNLIAIQTSGDLPASYTITLPDDAGNASEVLSTDGFGTLTWQPATVASVNVTSTTVEFTRTQANAFSELDAIYHDGASWELAQADNFGTLAEYVVVTANAASFTASKFGVYNKTGHGLSVGDHYFLSSSIAGGSSTAEAPLFSSPLFYVEDANTVHMEVLRPSQTADFASGTTRFRFLVGNSADVTNGAADFSSIQTAINFATAGNVIELLGDRIFLEDITIDRDVAMIGGGHTTIVSGTTTITSDGVSMERMKGQYDITINVGVKNVIIAPTVWVSATAVASGNATNNSINAFTEVP